MNHPPASAGSRGKSSRCCRGDKYRGGYSGGTQQFGGISYGGHGSTGDYGYGARGQYGESQFGGGFDGTTDAYGNPRPYGQSPQEYWHHYFSSIGYGPAPYYSGGSDQDRARRAIRRGPKGYRRSDARLKEDIFERLMHAEHIDSSEVSLEVQGGKVTLEGTVPARHMKHAIEDVADACPGVEDIDNRIRVQR